MARIIAASWSVELKLLPGAKLRFGDRRSIESRKAMPAGVTGGRFDSLSGDGLLTALIAFLSRGRC